jgi:integrase/recombinase XerD
VTHLRRIMLEELQRRNQSDGMIRHYLHFVEEFARHFGKSPDKLGLNHLRSYQALPSPAGRRRVHYRQFTDLT